MPRGKADKQQYLDAYKHHASGLPRLGIRDKLLTKYKDKTISPRSIGAYQKEFRELPRQVVEEDAEFKWEKLDVYGIPWTDSIRILALVEMFTELREEGPSGRQAKWMWRKSQTMPDWGKYTDSEKTQLVTMAVALAREELEQELGKSRNEEFAHMFLTMLENSKFKFENHLSEQAREVLNLTREPYLTKELQK